MSEAQAPAGWYADSTDSTIVRYWDGTAWTAHTAPAAAIPPTPASNAVAGVTAFAADPGVAAAQSPKPPNVWQRLSTKWKVVIGVVAAFFLIGIITSAGSDKPKDDKVSFADSNASATPSATQEVTTAAPTETPSATPTPTNAPKPKSAGFGSQPGQEKSVIKAIVAARTEYDNASNSLQEGVALSGRDKKICSILGNGQVSNWTGKVYTLDSNGDGKGVLGINIEPNTQVETWNNALSDSADHTLIEAGPLLDRIAKLQKGQVVRFSGQFVRPLTDDSCFNNPRFTKSGKISKPLMTFRFSDVHAE